MRKWLWRLYCFLTFRFKRPALVVTQAILCGDCSFVYVRYYLSRPDKINESSPIYLENEETGEKLALMNFVKFGEIKTKHKRRQPSGIFIFRNIDEVMKKGSTAVLFFDGLSYEHIKIE